MRRLLFIFLLGLFCRNVWALSDIESLDVIRNAMTEKLLDAHGVKLKQETSVDVAFVRDIAPRQLEANIVASTIEIAGAIFSFESEQEKFIGVWIFSYRDNKTALKNAKKIEGVCQRGNFRSKILTPFSCTVTENKVIIVFTESGRDESLKNFIRSIPQLFENSVNRSRS